MDFLSQILKYKHAKRKFVLSQIVAAQNAYLRVLQQTVLYYIVNNSSPTDPHRPPSSRSTLSLASMGARLSSQQRLGTLLKPSWANIRAGGGGGLLSALSRCGSSVFIEDKNDHLPWSSRAADRSVRSMSQPRKLLATRLPDDLLSNILKSCLKFV